MIEFKKMIDTEKHLWCREAALVRVAGGRGALTSAWYEETDDYTVKSHLLLNGKPIEQGEYPECPTCCALFARGYGTEKTDCEELKMIRDKINSDYTDFRTALQNIEPILDLLDDGYYVVADAKLYPTDGSGRFFMNVPNKLSDIDAARDQYYNHELLNIAEGFPAYIYPTQSNSALNVNQAGFYIDKIDKDNAPRAVAYYDYGFVCALLDGHHKAYAAAMKGCTLSALVIIPLTCIGKDWRTQEEHVCFADITLPLSDIDGFESRKKIKNQAVDFEEYHNEPISEEDLKLGSYPTADELAGLYSAEVENIDFTPEIVEKWIKSSDSDNHERLRCALRFYAKQLPEQAYMIAKTIVSLSGGLPDYEELIVLSYKVIVNHKCEEAEQIVLDYIVDHDSKSAAWEICNLYWD